MGTLYIIGTPIGNLEDITLRAIETLKKVDIIACEDTRQTMKLLNHYHITKRLLSCRARNEKTSAPGLVSLLEDKDIAYVTDAGCPGVSDPGTILIACAREAGIPVIPIPGVSALTTLLSLSPFPGKAASFEGFLPIKSGKRNTRLKELLDTKNSFILYESPFRIVKLMTELAELTNILSQEGVESSPRSVLIGREMTKVYEEYLEGTPQELLDNLSARPSIKGEFAVLVSGKKKS